MTQNRKYYSKQFKIDAVKQVTEQGYNVSEAARNLGIHHSSLRRWKKQLETDGNQSFPGKGHMASLPTSRNKIRLYPAATEGLSRNRFVPCYGSQPEWVL